MIIRVVPICRYVYYWCSIASKINVIPEGIYLPISKQLSILALANLLAHKNISQISLQSAAVNCSFSNNLTLWK